MRKLYKGGAEGFGDGEINWGGDVIKLVLVDYAFYTPDLAAHRFLTAIPVGARVAISPALIGKSNVNGVLDASDVTVVGVSGSTVEAIVVFKDTGTEATSPLIGVWDSTAPGESGLPLIPNGGDVVISFSDGPDKVINLDA